MPNTQLTKRTATGLVSAPLGDRKKDLQSIAKREGTSMQYLASVLLSHCIDQIKAGKMSLTTPTIEINE
jgi:hypothetical protein